MNRRNLTRFIFVIILAMAWTPKLTRAESANTADHVVISELQTGSAASSSQEFVELYNPTDQAIALDGWLMQYHPAGATSSWTTRTSGGLHGSIPAQGFYLLSTTAYLPNADGSISSGMAASGGSLQLVDDNGATIDLVGWGTGVEFEGAPAPAPAAGGSLERLPGATNPSAGNGIDTNSNIDDFGARTSAEPQASTSATEVPGEVGVAPGPNQTGSDPTDAPPATNPSTVPSASQAGPVLINELFIDPLVPLSDAKDEFIELYNPNPAAVDLNGYTLKTGANFHDTYTLPSLVIAPGGYTPIYASQSKLALTNSGGAAELADPSGTVVDQTADYEGSMPGLSFSRFGDDWQWTQKLTPGAPNQLVEPPSAAKDSSSSKSTTTKKAAAKKTTAKTSSIKAPKAVKAPKAATIVASDQQKAGLGAKWLIIGLAAITLGYAIYEFRYDLQNYFVLAKRHYAARREARALAKRR